ncbi:MAG: helix-turn-helix domain-containing protein [Mycobacterium sp.]
MSAGRQRVWWDGVSCEVVTEHDILLAGLGARLDEARAILRAVVDEARQVVRDAAESGMSDRAIAATVGVHRATVKAWKTSPPNSVADAR